MDPLVERMDMVSNYQTISNDNIAKLAESSESGKVKNVSYIVLVLMGILWP